MKIPRANTKKEIALQTAEVDANYEAFQEQLPKLLTTEHKGKYALMRNREIKEFIQDFSEAVERGKRRFRGKPFSVQKVTDQPIHLGVHSLF